MFREHRLLLLLSDSRKCTLDGKPKSTAGPLDDYSYQVLAYIISPAGTAYG